MTQCTQLMALYKKELNSTQPLSSFLNIRPYARLLTSKSLAD